MSKWATCGACNQEMEPGTSCAKVPVEIHGTDYDPIPYGEDWNGYDLPDHCHDCNTPKGGFHHPGCDMERCPVCHGQLISCGCLDPVVATLKARLEKVASDLDGSTTSDDIREALSLLLAARLDLHHIQDEGEWYATQKIRDDLDHALGLLTR